MTYTPTGFPYHPLWPYSYSESPLDSLHNHPGLESEPNASVTPAEQPQIAGPSYPPQDLLVPEAPHHYPAYFESSRIEPKWPTPAPPYWVRGEPTYATDFREQEASSFPSMGNRRVDGTNRGDPESPPIGSLLHPSTVPAIPDSQWSGSSQAILSIPDRRNWSPQDFNNPTLLSTIPDIPNIYSQDNRGFNGPLLPTASPSTTVQASTSGGQSGMRSSTASDNQTSKEKSTGKETRAPFRVGQPYLLYLDRHAKQNKLSRGKQREEFATLRDLLPESKKGDTYRQILEGVIAHIKDLQQTLTEQDKEIAGMKREIEYLRAVIRRYSTAKQRQE